MKLWQLEAEVARTTHVVRLAKAKVAKLTAAMERARFDVVDAERKQAVAADQHATGLVEAAKEKFSVPTQIVLKPAAEDEPRGIGLMPKEIPPVRIAVAEFRQHLGFKVT
jgi:hypothetical protein